MGWTPWRWWRDRRKLQRLDVIPKHESAVRRLMADAHGGRYDALRSLDDAKRTQHAAVVMEGDYTGLPDLPRTTEVCGIAPASSWTPVSADPHLSCPHRPSRAGDEFPTHHSSYLMPPWQRR
jgi:hypothetical protein